ncbi:GTPase IMAP family member 8-like [Cyprinodon tularosa]|uniref:GTPase IMAP family member 8-like n=1 Tax=Cyprinodon tularosa TaxID=77115 RepID=UPI0018E2504E|nr:GTPase IMAP family member 8-like [Cyprinodon tularosa]
MAKIPDVSSFGSMDSLPELRMVLIGGEEESKSSNVKSSTGNFILGQEVFDMSRRTAQSEARQTEILGRRVTVVDTPGWLWSHMREDTPKLDQIEIQNSVHLCPPGPHVFLLVIDVESNLCQHVQQSLMEHLELFSCDVFPHTIVIFTTVTSDSDKKIESKIQRTPALQWILQQCGNRKHVLNICNREDRDQVRLLFEKIDTVVAANGGRHFSASNVKDMKEEILAIRERASKRAKGVVEQRKKAKAVLEGGKKPPEHLKLLLIGAQGTAKSSAGNTILGGKVFSAKYNVDGRTTHSKTCKRLVNGRELTVVDSPGWFYIHTLQETSEIDKLEIERSVYLCAPGPHAVLLVIPLTAAIHASYLTAVQEHMTLFRKDIWKHTLVLFTVGDWLGGKTVEERIESEEGLQWIVNMCGNRYHALNNMDESNRIQVNELIEKIEEMWAGNEDPCYEVDLNQAEQIEAEKEAGDKMGIRLKKINERKSRVLKELIGGQPLPLSDIRIVLLGQKCSGKGMTGDTILFKRVFGTAFNTAQSKRNLPHATCVKHEGDFNGVKVSVVETPGWFSDSSPPDWIKKELLEGVSMCFPGPHVFLLVVPIFRSFTEKDLKALVEVLKPLKERVWRHCMVLFTWGDWLSDFPVENYIVREGKVLQELLEKCGNRYHVRNPNRSDNAAQVTELFQKIIDLVKQNKGFFTTKVKQKKKQKRPWTDKQQQFIKEEWNKREEELIGKVMKALSNEPEEPTVPSVEVAHSMNEFFIPDLSGDETSEYGSISEFKIQQGHGRVAEWLTKKVRESEISSWSGNLCSSDTSVENLD